MLRARNWLHLACCSCLSGAFSCAGVSEPQSPAQLDPAPVSKSATPEGPAEKTEVAPKAIPTECAPRKDDLCVPAGPFVARLCENTYADVALHLFQGPWSRGYASRRTEAFNASGGATVPGWLELGEEVVILRAREPESGGIQVSGEGTSYDVLRWNGSCATLEGGELSLTELTEKLHSRVEWSWLGEAMRQALRTDSAIDETYKARLKECKGVSIGEVSKKCETLDAKLISLVVKHVRKGGALGAPDAIP